MTDYIEKEYNKLCKKYKLPKFKQFNEEFEVNTIEDTDFLLKNVLRRVSEKLDFYSNLINSVLLPDTSSLSSMHEVRFFSEREKSEMYKIFKKIMKIDRKIITLVLGHDEKLQSEFLNGFFGEWLEIKNQLVVFVKKMKDSWDRETTIEEDVAYFG